MKRTSIVFFITFLFLIIMSACKENVYMDWKLQNDKWLAIHKSDSGFVTTPSGLCYKVLNQGNQRHPNSGSSILVSYKGTLVDGSTFDQASNVGMVLSQAIPGWKEGIPKMQNGGNYIFYIPSKLGYDTASNNVKIPPHSVLIFNVTLIESQY